MTKDEALKLALEALEYIYEGANNQGPHTGISWRCASNKVEPVITALRQALANSALDKMAENAREIGLDYEPAQQQPVHPETLREIFQKYGTGRLDGFTAAVKEAIALTHQQAREQEQPAIPQDWKLVPLEPTDTMVQAAHHLDLSYMPGQEGADRAAIYRAMLNAAPGSAHEVCRNIQLAPDRKLPAQQEPVAAECKFDSEEKWARCEIAHHNLVQSEPEKWPGYQTRLLYTRPQAREPLTPEQVAHLWAFKKILLQNKKGGTMTKDEALKLALVALEDLGMKHYESTGEVLYKETFTAIKEALAQPEQEPVAWLDSDGFPWSKEGIACRTTKDTYTPLYTGEPPTEKYLEGAVIKVSYSEFCGESIEIISCELGVGVHELYVKE